MIPPNALPPNENSVKAPTNRPARMALLSEIFPPKFGGSGRWFWEAYRRFPAGEVVALVGKTPGDQEFDAQATLPIIRGDLALRDSGTLTPTGLKGYLRNARWVLNIRRQQPFSMLHCGRCITEGWVGWLLWKWAKIPYLVYVHGEDMNLDGAQSGDGVMSSRQHRWMAKHILRRAQRVVANSENSARLLRDQWFLPAEKVTVVHPGFDASRFQTSVPCPETRVKLGWQDRLVILTVGRLQKRKGHDHLIAALPGLVNRFPNLLYAIVGSGEELTHLQNLVQQHGLQHHVQFKTNSSDEELIRCYQQCDLFVLPNRQIGSDIEGFGMVLVEAQACGKPVIAGDSGGTRETMSVPETGLIVDCNGGPELANALAELLADPARRHRMGQAGSQFVRERFAWETVVKKMQTLFAS